VGVDPQDGQVVSVAAGQCGEGGDADGALPAEGGDARGGVLLDDVQGAGELIEEAGLVYRRSLSMIRRPWKAG